MNGNLNIRWLPHGVSLPGEGAFPKWETDEGWVDVTAYPDLGRVTDGLTISEIVPIGVDVRWLCKVEHPGIVGTAYASLSGREIACAGTPEQVERLKADRIEQAAQSLLERV